MNIDEMTEKTIGCTCTVSNELGAGFLEKVHENVLVIELMKQGLHVEQQKPVLVTYSGEIVGEHAVDLFVEDCVIIELKAVQALDNTHQAQLLNYLKAMGVQTGLLLNFETSKVAIKRTAFGN